MSTHPSLPHDNVPADLPSSPSSKNMTTHITKAGKDALFAYFDCPPKSLQGGNSLPRHVRQVWLERKRGGRMRGEPRRAQRAQPQRVPDNKYARTGGAYHAHGRVGNACTGAHGVHDEHDHSGYAENAYAKMGGGYHCTTRGAGERCTRVSSPYDDMRSRSGSNGPACDDMKIGVGV
jgi:hypothetical protein